MKPICITFAGPAGCSKTPVAHYLSCELGLPILTNDVVRSEVKEDFVSSAKFNTDEYVRRVFERIQKLGRAKTSFVYDASIDRHWLKFLSSFSNADDYDFAVISFDLSKAFYRTLLKAKGYDDLYPLADAYLQDHDNFLKEHAAAVVCTINDENFHERLAVSADAIRQFMADKNSKLR